MEMEMEKAIISGNIRQVKALLDRGADVNYMDSSGYTYLITSSLISKFIGTNTIKLLLDRGANVNQQGIDGYTALIFASMHSGPRGDSSLEAVKLLLDRGADVNIQTIHGTTALMLASNNISSMRSTLETIELLLEYGADPFIKDKNGKSAIDRCTTDGCKQVLGKAIWNKMHQQDMTTLSKYSSITPKDSGDFRNTEESAQLPKDVWELILLRKRQQELCQNLSNNKNREVLWYFAEMLNLPIDASITKKELCGLISKQLTYGKYYDEKTEFKQRRMTDSEIIRLAKKYELNTDRQINDIISDLAKLIN